MNRDSGTASANGGWLRRLVRRLVSHINHLLFFSGKSHSIMPSAFRRTFGDKRESPYFRNFALAVCSLTALVFGFLFINVVARSRLTKKAEPPPTRDVNRDSGTASANGGWLRRLVRHQRREIHNKSGSNQTLTNRKLRTCSPHRTSASRIRTYCR